MSYANYIRIQEKKESVESIHQDQEKEGSARSTQIKKQEKKRSAEGIHKDPRVGKITANYVRIQEKKSQ